MADRVDARIRIGGPLPSRHLRDFLDAVQAEDLRPAWDEVFETPEALEDYVRRGEHGVVFYGQQVGGGEFTALQALCSRLGLTYILTYDGYGGEWAPARRIRTPDDAGDGVTCPLSQDGGDACLTAEMIRRHGLQDRASILAFLGRFDAEATPPMIVVDPD